MPSRPIMIAVGGDSGAGKTTLCRGLERIFGDGRVRTIALDDYHSLDRAQRRAVDMTALDPRASNFAAMEEDLWAIREGREIDKPVYDHSRGSFGAPERIDPKEIVVVRGLFPLYTRALRSLFDVTAWLDPEPELQARWKVQRDRLRRGYAESDLRAQALKRRADAERYVRPQAKYADLIVTFYRSNARAEEADSANLSARIRKGGRFRPLDYSEFASDSTSIRQTEQTAEGGYPETLIELDGDIEASVAESVADRIWTHLRAADGAPPARVGEFEDARGNAKIGHALALTQLLIARRVVLVEDELLEMA